MNYHDYMRSPAWRQNRDRAMRLAGFACEFCGEPAYTAHHAQYPNAFVHDSEKNLVAVCDRHHALCHGKRESNMNTDIEYTTIANWNVMIARDQTNGRVYCRANDVMAAFSDGLLENYIHRAKGDMRTRSKILEEGRQLIRLNVLVNGVSKLEDFWDENGIREVSGACPGVNAQTFIRGYEDEYVENKYNTIQATNNPIIDGIMRSISLAVRRSEANEQHLLRHDGEFRELRSAIADIPAITEVTKEHEKVACRTYLREKGFSTDWTIANKWGEMVNLTQWFGTVASKQLGKAQKVTEPGTATPVSVRTRAEWDSILDLYREQMIQCYRENKD